MEAVSLPRSSGGMQVRSPRLLATFSDERLVAQVRRGNEAAFEAVYDRHHRGILAFCRHMLGSQVEAEDAVQQTFVSAYGDLVSSDKPIKLKAWLYTIARNRCLSTLRSRHEQATELVDVPTAGLSDAVLERDELRRLLADVAALPWDQRAALVLAELRDLSHAEIAEIVGCHVLKVKSLVFQARSSLIESRAAQEIPCVEIRKQIATLRGGALRRGSLRRHLRACPACSEYRDSVRRQRQMLSLVLPVTPSAGLKYAVLTGAGTGPTALGGAAVGGGAVGGAVAGGGAASGGAAGAGGGALAAATGGIGGGSLLTGIGGGLAAKLAITAAVVVGGGLAVEQVATNTGTHSGSASSGASAGTSAGSKALQANGTANPFKPAGGSAHPGKGGASASSGNGNSKSHGHGKGNSNSSHGNGSGGSGGNGNGHAYGHSGGNGQGGGGGSSGGSTGSTASPYTTTPSSGTAPSGSGTYSTYTPAPTGNGNAYGYGNGGSGGNGGGSSGSHPVHPDHPAPPPTSGGAGHGNGNGNQPPPAT